MSTATQPLEPIERASRDEMTSLKLSRLGSLLAHAYPNVPMYRERFDATGVHADDVRNLSDADRQRR